MSVSFQIWNLISWLQLFLVAGNSSPPISYFDNKILTKRMLEMPGTQFKDILSWNQTCTSAINKDPWSPRSPCNVKISGSKIPRTSSNKKNSRSKIPQDSRFLDKELKDQDLLDLLTKWKCRILRQNIKSWIQDPLRSHILDHPGSFGGCWHKSDWNN